MISDPVSTAPFLLCNIFISCMTTGNSPNLWKAVKMAKNLNCDSIPTNMTLGGVPLAANMIAGSFGTFFANKVDAVVNRSSIKPDQVYNGKKS